MRKCKRTRICVCVYVYTYIHVKTFMRRMNIVYMYVIYTYTSNHEETVHRIKTNREQRLQSMLRRWSKTSACEMGLGLLPRLEGWGWRVGLPQDSLHFIFEDFGSQSPTSCGCCTSSASNLNRLAESCLFQLRFRYSSRQVPNPKWQQTSTMHNNLGFPVCEILRYSIS